jgi:hypothetical protein
MQPLPQLHAYRFRDPATGKWHRARQRATLAEIRARHAAWELIHEPDYGAGDAAMLNPFACLGFDDAPCLAPLLDDDERILVACFLRRYVRYCARRGKVDAMQHAAALLRRLRTSSRVES